MRFSSRETSAIYEKIHEFQIRRALRGPYVPQVTSRFQSLFAGESQGNQ